MQVNMPIITEHLKKTYPNLKLMNYGNENLKGVKVWNYALSKQDSDYLYICNAFETKQLTREIYNNMNFIIVGEPEIPLLNINYIITYDYIEIMELLENVCYTIEYIRSWHNALLQSIVIDNDVQALIKISYNYFDNPLLVFDPWRKTIAQAGFTDQKPPSNVLQNINGDFYIDFDLFNKLYGKDWLNKINTLSAPTYFESKNVGNPYILTNVKSKGKNLAILIVAEENASLTNWHLLLSKDLAKCIRIVLERIYRYDYKCDTMDDMFFIKALKGQKLGKSQIEYHLKQLGWENNNNYTILVIRSKEDEKVFTDNVSYFRHSFITMYPDLKVIVLDSSIVIIVNIENSHFYNKASIRDFRATLTNRNLICGISNRFNDFSEISTYYKQACYVINKFNTLYVTGSFIYYENHMIDHIIDELSDRCDIMSYLHPAILKLIKNDINNQSDFINTLYVYLLNNKSYVACAKKMYLHHNTVTYRINKIKEITEVDFDDEETKLSMLFSIRMYNRFKGITTSDLH